MSYIRDTEIYKGYTIEIVADEDPESPREWDNASELYCWHRRYNLGDLQDNRPISENYSEPEDLLYELADIDKDEYWEQHEKYPEPSEIYDAIEKNGHLVSMLYLYDHSGISISSSPWIGRAQHAEWDSGPVGYQVMRKETIEREWDGDKDRAWKCMDGEIETYNEYLTGDVWGFRIEETGESCWGFYGDEGIKDALQEARGSVDWYIREKVKKHLKQLKTWIIGKVPEIYRKPLMLST